MLLSLNQVLADQIKDLYNAENQLVKALPKMAQAAKTRSLKDAFAAHLEETKEHVSRLEDIATLLDSAPTGKTCKAMRGLVEEGQEVLDREESSAAIDALLIAAAQRVEHYEISAYGTARAMAEHLGNKDIAKILQSTLDEERAADTKLTDISESEVFAMVSEGQKKAAHGPEK